MLACILSARAQQKDSIAQKQLLTTYRQAPVWIQMMENPNVNYYEACKAFDTYWQGKEIPAESEGEANKLYEKKEEKEKERKDKTYDKEEHEDTEGLHFKDPTSYTMIYQYKRFINWRLVMKNKIDPVTGRLLTPEEQRTIWENQTQGINTHIQ